jgi:hypothetical protein
LKLNAFFCLTIRVGQDRQLGDPIRSAIIDHAIAERSANFLKKLIAER